MEGDLLGIVQIIKVWPYRPMVYNLRSKSFLEIGIEKYEGSEEKKTSYRIPWKRQDHLFVKRKEKFFSLLGFSISQDPSVKVPHQRQNWIKAWLCLRAKRKKYAWNMKLKVATITWRPFRVCWKLNIRWKVENTHAKVTEFSQNTEKSPGKLKKLTVSWSSW